jgi:SAM-dependent MidA family methyltransferase
VHIVELGPGRGTMMLDALRAVQVVPGFHAAIAVHLVEISPALRARQRRAFKDIDVPVEWYRTLEEVPEGPTIILANEFFDALPVQQAVMCADGWHERVVKIADDNSLQFSNARDPIPLFDEMLPPAVREARIGEIFEWRADQIALELGRRVVRANGAALVIDYGHRESATGETLQAVGLHDFVHPLTTPGQIDLTAHVDFQALGQAAESMDARLHGPLEQGEFLRRMGIAARAERLKAGASPSEAAEIDAAYDRLTSQERTGMGQLFKVIGFSHPKLGPLPCF